VVVQRQSGKPIGEGQVFIADIATAEEVVSGSSDPDSAVRRTRNTLKIEAVSLLDDAGVVIASTSGSLVGQRAHDQLIATGVADRRFVGLASAIEEDLYLDGVVQWEAGSVLYQVVSPLEASGGSVLLHYDVSLLLSRRTIPGAIQSGALQLLGLAAVFAVFAGVIRVGHSRAALRYREVAQESQFLRSHSKELEVANKSLDLARNQAEDALALAEEKIRIRSEFVLMINHELRTPLTSVVTGAELLRSTQLSEADRAIVLDSMVADGARLQEIIDQILAVARIENRGLAYELTEMSLDEVRSTVSKAHSGAVDMVSGPGRDLTVRTDASALSLVVASLVDNALTHGAGSVSVGCATSSQIVPQLEVGDRPHQGVFITVADDGPGIDGEFLPRIFEKFEKSSFSSGTGLGLYMVRMIIEALEGSLSVQTSSAGTTFQISIPALPVRHRVVA
jgi:signal transduction histidine kinase